VRDRRWRWPYEPRALPGSARCAGLPDRAFLSPSGGPSAAEKSTSTLILVTTDAPQRRGTVSSWSGVTVITGTNLGSHRSAATCGVSSASSGESVALIKPGAVVDPGPCPAMLEELSQPDGHRRRHTVRLSPYPRSLNSSGTRSVLGISWVGRPLRARHPTSDRRTRRAMGPAWYPGGEPSHLDQGLSGPDSSPVLPPITRTPTFSIHRTWLLRPDGCDLPTRWCPVTTTIRAHPENSTIVELNRLNLHFNPVEAAALLFALPALLGRAN